MSDINDIKDKDWLDLVWKHFQQHAQQRILYFNYFVVFSTILTTGLVTTFQLNFQATFLGIGIGIIQIFLSIMFWKIDQRNRFLTKHAEKTIMKIEKDYDDSGKKPYKLFTIEKEETEKNDKLEKSTFFLLRQIPHGKSFKIIYGTFIFIGLLESIVSVYNFVSPKNQPEKQAFILSIRSDSAMVKEIEDSVRTLFIKQNAIILKVDTLSKQVNTYFYKSIDSTK